MARTDKVSAPGRLRYWLQRTFPVVELKFSDRQIHFPVIERREFGLKWLKLAWIC